MMVKMIQNLENKIELQIHRLETKIKKMPDMFNRDLEEVKKGQSIRNNALTEIKSTLEGTTTTRPSPWKRNAKMQSGCLRRPYK